MDVHWARAAIVSLSLLVPGCNRVAQGSGADVGDGDGDGDVGPDDLMCPPFREPTILADGLSEMTRSLALDEQRVYLTERWRVLSVPKEGGAPSELAVASSPIRDLGVDETHVYWTDVDGVYRVAKSGGGPESLASAETGRLVLTESDVFFTAYLDDEIRSVPKTGGQVTTWLETVDVDVVTELVTDGRGVFILRTSAVPAGSLHRIDLVDGTTTIVAEPEHVVRDLHVDDAHVYFSWEDGRRVLRVAHDGDLSVEEVSTTEGSAFAVGSDEERVYWTDDVLGGRGGGYAGKVRCLSRGESEATTISEYPTLAAVMRVDDSGVYWTVFGESGENAALYKLSLQ